MALRRLRRRFTRVDQDSIEDAVGFAIVDLLDYWVHASRSIAPDNPDKTFWYAVRRAEWMAIQFLGQSLQTRCSQDSLEQMTEDGHEPTHAGDVDEGILEEEDRAFALAKLADLDAEQVDWLSGHLAGTSARAEARERGLHVSTVCYRRERVLNELRASARSAGLVE